MTRDTLGPGVAQGQISLANLRFLVAMMQGEMSGYSRDRRLGWDEALASLVVNAENLVSGQTSREHELASGLTEERLAVLQKALAIGAISYDGDGWFAKDAGYDYDDAETTLTAAREILDRLATPVTPEGGEL